MTADAVSLLEAMLRIPSLSGQERVLAEYLVSAMASLGFRAWVDEVGNAIGERGDGSKEVVLLGHMDTVVGEIPVRHDGDVLYGRGAVDAKGPLAAFIIAAASTPVPDGHKLVVVGAVGEEAASSEGARHVILRYAPVAAIIGEPSGWEHITLGYKGRLLIVYELRQEVAHTARGEASVVEQAIAFWSWVKGLSVGCSAPQSRQFDKLVASLRDINSGSDGLVEQVAMEIVMRLPPGFDAAAFKRAATEMAAPAQVGFHGYEMAFRAEKNTPLVRALLQAVRSAGGQPHFSVKMGTSDMNVVGPAWGCPIVAYGPGDSDLDHTPHEHINLSEYRRSIGVLQGALTALTR